MKRPATLVLGLCVGVLFASPLLADNPRESRNVDLPPIQQVVHKGQVIADFMQKYPANRLNTDQANRITRVYGPAFAKGSSPKHSAEQFREAYAGMWGIPASDLVARGPFADGRHVQPIMYNRTTGQYKFTGLYYTQQRDGIDVYKSRLTLLTRNEPGYPLVLASADLRDIGTFRVDPEIVANPNVQAAFRNARQQERNHAELTDPRLVIFAGVDEMNHDPRLALVFQSPEWEYVADARTGEILYQEPMIYHIDIVGTVSGMATEGYAADVCGPESPRGLPYAEVKLGGTTVYADVDGNFVIPYGGASMATVQAGVRGRYFRVMNPGSQPSATLSQSVTPPGPVHFLFNAANNSEFERAEVNAYIHANIVRDHALAQNPAYPAIANELNFPVNVNIAQTCNAFYSPLNQSINFYVAGGGCTNTAVSTVVYHEYGHRLINAAGSGQGAYGEGMSDCVAITITDSPCLGGGFNGPCGSCLRNANNNCQYQSSGCSSCGSAIHTCGTVLSGSVWHTRNELVITEPDNYLDILSSLTINSILLHTGSSVNPNITVDFLTLDDDNDDITDGTPHYFEIATGFGMHNMDAPPLAPIRFVYPNGRPDYISPNGNTVMRVEVLPLMSSPQPGTAMLHVNTGGSWAAYPMTQVSANVYDAVFPAVPCGSEVRFYVSAQTTGGQTVNSPGNGATEPFMALGAAAVVEAFADNFEQDLGWTVLNNLADGGWERAIPTPLCNRGNPQADADGSGYCYLTDNGTPGDCNSDVDNGTTILTSPVLDASGGQYAISYWRWFSNYDPQNTNQNDIFQVEISDNGGMTWRTLEVVGPTGPGTMGGWYFKRFDLSSIPGFVQNDQFRIRFIASDLGVQSVTEAAVDGVKLIKVLCSNPCPADIDGSSTVDVDDLLTVIGSWGPCPGCAADINSDNVVNVDDLLAVIGSWGSCQ